MNKQALENAMKSVLYTSETEAMFEQASFKESLRELVADCIELAQLRAHRTYGINEYSEALDYLKENIREYLNNYKAIVGLPL